MKYFIFYVLCNCAAMNSGEQSKFMKIDKLWSKKSELNEIRKILGEPSGINNLKVIYNFPKTNTPEIYFSLDSKLKIIRAFTFLDETQFNNFKEYKRCKWIVTVKHQQKKDIIDKYHTGYCENEKIKFEYKSSMKLYEVWWGLD